MVKTVAPLLIGVRNVMLVAAMGFLGYGGYQYVVKFGKIDPFRAFEGTNPLGGSTALQMENVGLHEYRKGKLRISADLKRVRVDSSHTDFDLLGVKNGLYAGPNGGVRFAAGQGSWNENSQRLSMFGGVRTQGKQFDVQTSAATVDRANEKLEVPTSLSGKLYGGAIRAANLVYDLRTSGARGGPIHWQGTPQAGVTGPIGETVHPRIWDIRGSRWSQGAIQTFEHAKATDGDCIIYAPLVQRDPKTDVVTATGRVTYFSGKVDVIADKAVIYRKEKRAVFTGNVDMLVKPKKDQDRPPKEESIPEVSREALSVKPITADTVMTPEDKKRDDDLRSGKTLRQYPISVTSEDITYWYGKGSRHAIIQGSPVALQTFPDDSWRKGWSHQADYDGEKDTMQLNSLPGERDARMENSIGDIYHGTWLKFSTKEDQPEGQEDIQGEDVDAVFVDRSGEDTRAPRRQTGASAPANPPATVTQPTTGGGHTGG